MADYLDAGVVNIIQLIYQQRAYEGQAKDYEFSAASMREHWRAGYQDNKKTLRRREWLKMPSAEDGGIQVHDIYRDPKD